MKRWMPALLLLGLAWLVLEPLLLVAIDAVRVDGVWTLAAVRAFFVEPNEWRAAWNSLWLALVELIVSQATFSAVKRFCSACMLPLP